MRDSFSVASLVINALIAIGTISATFTALWLSYQQDSRLTNDTLKISFEIYDKDSESGRFVTRGGALSSSEEEYLGIHVDNAGHVNAYITSMDIVENCQTGYTQSEKILEKIDKGANDGSVNPRERQRMYINFKTFCDMYFCGQDKVEDGCKAKLKVRTVLHTYSEYIPDEIMNEIYTQN